MATCDWQWLTSGRRVCSARRGVCGRMHECATFHRPTVAYRFALCGFATRFDSVATALSGVWLPRAGNTAARSRNVAYVSGTVHVYYVARRSVHKLLLAGVLRLSLFWESL